MIAPENPDAQAIEDVFRYCPRCGTENTQIGRIPFRCSECAFSNFFGPVAAVGALIVNDQNQLLLVRRARDPGKGCWGLPGGFVDRDESIEQALAREVIEETELVVESCQLLMTHPNQYNYQGIVVPVVDLFYTCKVTSVDSVTLAPDELEHYEWVRPEPRHLENMAFHSNRLALEKWMQIHST